MWIEIMSPYMERKYNNISFSPEEEEPISKLASGDIIAKLELVKNCMDLVVKLANWFSSENELPFQQVLQAGVSAVIRAAESFDSSKKMSFIDYASQEIVKAMMSILSA